MTINLEENEGMDRKIPQIDFPIVLAGTGNFDDIQEKLLRRLNIMRTQEGVQRIGFVSGRTRNKAEYRKLAAYTKKLREEYEFPIFSSMDIFGNNELWKKLPEPKLPEAEKREKFFELFDEILGGGVTDIFMTPGWDDKDPTEDHPSGSEHEHATAKNLGINIHDVPVDEQISKL